MVVKVHISTVIAKTAGTNVTFKAAKIAESVFAGQSETLTREVATIGASTEEEALDDLGLNADLQYVIYNTCALVYFISNAFSLNF